MSELQLVLKRNISLDTTFDMQHLEEGRLLVEQARTDAHAFGRIFDRHYDEIFKYILHRTANTELARDLTADTFFKAMNKLWTFRWQNVPFSAWLYRIASNEVNAHFRKHKNVIRVPLEEIMENPGSEYRELKEELKTAQNEIDNNHLFLELHQAVTRLKPRYQEAVTLRFFEGKSVKDVAVILNKSEGTVKSLLHRALKQLQDILDSDGTKNNPGGQP